jgi:hypothetical protein
MPRASLSLAVDQGAEGRGEARHVAAHAEHLLAHVAQRLEGLGVAAPGQVDHMGQPGCGMGGLRLGIGVWQSLRVVQAGKYSSDDDAVLVIQTFQQAGVAATFQDLAYRGYELTPALAFGMAQSLLEWWQHVAVVAGLYHSVDEPGVHLQDLLGLVVADVHGRVRLQ